MKLFLHLLGEEMTTRIFSPDQEAFGHQGRPHVQRQAAQVGQSQGLVPLVPALPGDRQGRVEVPPGLRDAALLPQTQSQEVVDHAALRGAVCALEEGD